MSGSKYLDRIAWTVTALILVLSFLLMSSTQFSPEIEARTLGYEKLLFDQTRVHSIDIVMDDWDGFLNNVVSEDYCAASVVIDGEAYRHVGIRGKGNTSLSSVAAMNSSRYSFKIEFDQYDSSLSYHGLDKLNLNNLIQDTTMMKDYLSYTMMQEFGVNAPLCSFVYITVNGEDWGLYLAVEGVEEAFLCRNYGSVQGELYKPDSMSFGGGRGNGRDFNMDDFINREEFTAGFETFTPEMILPQQPDRNSVQKGRGGFGGGMGSADVKLQYLDDDPDSYANIWDSAKTDISRADQRRLMESLRKLNAGEAIDSVVDIDQVIRYFVVHNYVCNGDSYTGAMVHNYYLYEEDGRMAMIPWDYNLAFGTFQGGDAQAVVNTPIDSPVSGGASSDRPMWNWIMEDTEYTGLYHRCFTEFLDTVDITGIIDSAYALIEPYVARDPTCFYGFDEFEAGVGALREFCTLRSESVTAQLANGRTGESMNYADASGLALSAMGSMGRGGGMPDRQENRGAFPEGTMPEGLPQGNQLPDFSGSFNPFQLPAGRDGQFPDQAFSAPDSSWSGEVSPSESELPLENRTGDVMARPVPNDGQMPGGDFRPAMNDRGIATGSLSGWLGIAVSVLILCAGLVIVKLYRA
ncbi:MAG: CotH kinase family protein [Bacillota bacterium]|nr:CotH kinase family protein [Bacillota bacterium]